jgi:hypothetical protein
MNLTNQTIKTLYLDYLNNFMTVKYFAEYYGITMNTAQKIIIKGRALCG